MKDIKLELSDPPKIGQIEFKIEKLDRFKDTNYYNYILNFYNTTEQKLTKEELNVFYDNIRSLDIHEKMFLFDIRGEYATKTNQIFILKNFFKEDTLNHELLHMSSTVCDYKNDIVYSGLSYYSKKIKLGDGLNEGYTELQNRRLFDSDNKEHCYECQIVLAKLIEKIIGNELMRKLYFTADLNTLIKILQIYNNQMPVGKFIKYIDKTIESDLLIVRKFKEDFNTDYFKYITSYLITTYTNKMYLKYLKGDITEDEYLRNIDYYVESIFDIFNIKEEYRPRFNICHVEKSIDNNYKNAKALIRK